MKGLFLKDFYNLRQLLLWYGVMMALFIAAAVISKNLSFMMGFGVFITISTASSSMAYDEKDNWYKFARACGLSPLAIAAEKYLLTLALGALSFALLAVCQAVIGEIDDGRDTAVGGEPRAFLKRIGSDRSAGYEMIVGMGIDDAGEHAEPVSVDDSRTGGKLRGVNRRRYAAYL